MSPVLFFYLADVIENIQGCLIAMSICLAMAILANAIDKSIEDSTKIWPFTKKIFPFIAVILVIVSLLPSKQTMYLMAASTVVMDVAQNERVQSIANNSLKIIEDKIKEYATEEKK